jgi:hypothetical protein
LGNALSYSDQGSILGKVDVSAVGAIIMLHDDNIGFFRAVVSIGMARFNMKHTTLPCGGDS